MMAGASRSPIRGSHLILTLVGIALATVVLPPTAAWRLNQYRVEQTTNRAARAAERMRGGLDSLASLAGAIEVACGPGRVPESSGRPAQDAWLRKAVVAPSLFGDGMPTDAWGHCFLMNLSEGPRGARMWILSAGPNGVIDTPLGADELSGDDIGGIVK